MSYRNIHPAILTAAICSIYRAADKGASGDAPAATITDLKSFIADHPIVEILDLELKKIVIDAGTQPRVAIDNDVVQEYGEIVKSAIKSEQPNPFDNLPDEKLPQVFRDPTGRCVLAEGFHRYGGHKAAHAKEMKVAIREGSERDALIFSLSTNQEHGVRRTNKDKQRALKIALKDPDLSQSANTEIARFVGVSEFTVREARNAIGSPSVRKVTIRGKQTTMDTSAIGKGKGGGKKGAKASSKSTSKSKTTKTAGATVVDDTKGGLGELRREIMKIQTVIGGKKGEEFFAAVDNGSLELSKRDIKDWAGFKDSTIRNIAELVMGGARMKPMKAVEFLNGGVPEKMEAHLHNLAIGNGGTFVHKGEGVVITVEHKGK